MKFLLTLAFFFNSPLAQAKAVAYYTYLKAKKPVKKQISGQELKRAYQIVRSSTFMPPAPQTFFDDYLRFKMGVEVALNEKSLVTNPKISNMISNPFLRAAFEQELYKALAELKLKKAMEKLDKTAANLSSSVLKKRYANEPEFNIFFIAVSHPINPSPGQLKEVESRAKKVYARVSRSKKPFLELVALYSDDKSNGSLGINRSRASIFPAVYKRLKTMKDGQISMPIRVPSGYHIVKLNKRIPFADANQMAIKANYFNEGRAKIYLNYFNRLKKNFRLNIVNRDIVKSL